MTTSALSAPEFAAEKAESEEWTVEKFIASIPLDPSSLPPLSDLLKAHERVHLTYLLINDLFKRFNEIVPLGTKADRKSRNRIRREIAPAVMIGVVYIMDRIKTLEKSVELSRYGAWLMYFRKKLVEHDTVKNLYRPQALTIDPNTTEGIEFASDDLLRMRAYMVSSRRAMDWYPQQGDDNEVTKLAIREWELVLWYQEARLVKDPKIGETFTKEMIEQHLKFLWDMQEL